MFTYICLGTNDVERATRFYDAALAPLGISRCDMSREGTVDGWMCWGTCKDDQTEELALWVCTPIDGRAATAGNGTMIALHAATWAQVRACYRAALDHGGRSEGEPGLRPQYNDDFYAAYVRDPDGNKLAFVCRGRSA